MIYYIDISGNCNYYQNYGKFLMFKLEVEVGIYVYVKKKINNKKLSNSIISICKL